jgi:hypothetical protein
MQIGFLIITYGNKYLNECISSIRKFHNNIPIYIVDNMKENNINIVDNNIFYSKNINNNYELGSIWFAAKKWDTVEKFIILHNSMILLQKLPEFIFKDDFVPFWQANVIDYSPVVPVVEKWLLEQNIVMKRNKSWKSICGCCCSINTAILKELIKLNYDKFFATTKHQAVATEIFFGYIIDNVLNITYKNVLYKYPIYTYIHNKQKSIYIKKIGGGQGNCRLNTIINYDLNNKYNNILSIYNNNLHINDNYINLLKYINDDEEFGNYLLINYPNQINNINKNLKSILGSITHRMFSKKYFKDDYLIEYNEIINKKKIIL